MRDELELQLLSELQRAGCFRSVAPAADEGETVKPSPDSIKLNIAVSELFEETTYDTSIAQRTDPMAPQELELLHTSRIRAVMRVALEHAASGVELRARSLRADGAHRPLILGEDARQAALLQATIEAAESVRRFVCKGGAKRLSKELRSIPGS
ncbi:MAG: hypothetical protein GTO33_05665 [Acidobacteria bacterium]|nr:hypothetical protein [Acidobacteriota bacterium]NIO58826.1 hypothetical protein [Acidobacteriota bacterium]NIQ84607.1 hypothetical protein [Acidobacteriota bacterium]NIT12421.1 hypothetical protein [Acidobacteriota bacterium]